MKRIILCTALLALAAPSNANDSSAAIGLGGLTLTQSDAVRIDSEELFLSMQRVTVKYRFTNTSAKDVETLVSFPLPPVPDDVGYYGDTTTPDWKADLDFRTLVDGKPVELGYREEVIVIGRPEMKDALVRLKELGWPVRHWDDYEFDTKFIQPLSPAKKAELVKAGLLAKLDETGEVFPNWQVQAHVTRRQIFPAGKTISVEHSYKPVMGGSVGGILDRDYRSEQSFKDYAAAYCIDKAFLTGFDKKRYAKKRDADGNPVGQFYVEKWLSYVLKSGANWKGPIRDFRLVVDKGSPANLVSFCMTGVKKISPTQFEVRKTNFEPAKDLDILIVEWPPLP